ncbi:MAG: hypothetical protein L0Y76_11440, partial [Ignavibacteria bacterium]|nr:hypothetical protein [Ignavibacteria bacterium]
IKAGALDSINKNRTYLISQLESELDKVGSEKLQYLERQNLLFGEAVTIENTEIVSNGRGAGECNQDDLLQYEKEAFGFYFSCHPLEKYETEFNALGLVSVNRLDNIMEKQQKNAGGKNIVHLGGVVLNRNQKKDRKGQDYAVFNLEDFTGITEIIAFSDVYAKSKQFLRPDLPIIIRGRVSSRDELKTQIEAKDIIPFTDWQSYFNSLVIVIKSEEFNKAKIKSVKDILEKYQGPKPVFIKVKNSPEPDTVYSHNDPGVSFSKELISDLNELLGKSGVRIVRNERVQY